MASYRAPLPVNPGKGIGFLALGASLHDILIRLKAQPHIYPEIDVSYSSFKPLIDPVVITLPHNGLRLRFDGPDQRLRLIEVLEFSKVPLTYKNIDLVKPLEETEADSCGAVATKPVGPAFRQVYHKLFGPTFAGEYIGPKDDSASKFGTYILSYPGVALSFPLKDSVWSGNTDFVSLLSTSAALPATSLSIYNGSSWKDARSDLYTRPCSHPRSLALGSRNREGIPDEIECVKICGYGKLEMLRRSSPPFYLFLGETTTQDLVAELGPPDAIYRKNDRRLSIHKARTRSGEQPPYSALPAQFDGISDTERSSINTTTDDSDPEESVPAVNSSSPATECFYNYFHHGFDVFVSYATTASPGLVPSHSDSERAPPAYGTDVLLATKILLHANVPGSYPFNRYRRSRWVLDPEQVRDNEFTLNSETPFAITSAALRYAWGSTYASEDDAKSLQRAMVLNRGWGDSPGSSCELLGEWDEGGDMAKRHTTNTMVESVTGLGNTELFGFPGLLFEVLKNNTVSCLTVY